MMKTRTTPLTKQFQFAGFSWPRYVAMLPKGGKAERLKRYKDNPCGPYYHVPSALKKGNSTRSFYFCSDFAPGLRWHYCDDIAKSISHSGWFCDDFGRQKIRGIVFALPHGRGWLVGWTMGENMLSVVDYGYVYTDETGAAYAADRMAESAAETEREYRQENDDDENS